MKSKNQPKKSKDSEKEGAVVISSAILVSVLKFFVGMKAAGFLSWNLDVSGRAMYYFLLIIACVLIYALVDVIFFFVLKSKNIKYSIKTYVALAVIPVVIFASDLIFMIFDSRVHKPSVEPRIVWLIMSLGFAVLTAGIGRLVKLLPRKV